jgi:hypothetical protein
MQAVGDTLRRAGVAAIYLAHGTFVGPDTLGIVSELARAFPSASQPMRRMIRRLINHLTGDVGNYTESYARLFSASINSAGQRRIPVRLFEWSSENHHIGRADGAVRLLDELASRELGPENRALLWGHSHAGNVFALMTNLLAGSPEAIEEFFHAAEIYYRWPILGCIDIPVWERVWDLLKSGRLSPQRLCLDLVTFGTPVRYGWDSVGYAHLLHFIHRRPTEGVPEYRASFPPKLTDIVAATEGDYVQQLGIAGTNVMPSIFAWRAWLADNRLERLLQSEASPDGLLERFQAGTIVPEEGTALLVDYGRPKGGLAKHHAGHAVYTQKDWLLFHAEEVVRQFYQRPAQQVA